MRERTAASPYGFALVMSAGGVLLGRLRGSALGCDPQLQAEDGDGGGSVDRPVRHARAKRLGERDLRWAIITDPEGRLIGIARREDLEQA